MAVQAYTVAFQGMEARQVEVQCHLSSGTPAFALVGLPDKAVEESKERVRAALNAIGLALPPKRITINLAPADLPKEGAHYDLPIALALLAALDIAPPEDVARSTAMGELSLDGRLSAVPGALPAALSAAEADRSKLADAIRRSKMRSPADKWQVQPIAGVVVTNRFSSTLIGMCPA